MSQNSKLHKHVPTTFRLSPVNGLLGSYSRFNKENFGQQVGELAELIFRIFYEDKSVFSYADTLSLINVTNYVNARSTGYSISPPDSVIGFNTGLAFTFALSARPYSKRLPELNSKEKNSDGVDTVSYWSTGGSSYTYLTISFDKSSLRRLSLSFNTERELIYLYNSIGLLSKSFVLYKDWYNTNYNHDDASGNLSAFTMYTRYFGKSIRNMFNDTPMPYWLYCKEFWFKAQNLLSPRFLNIDEFGLYYLVHLADIIPTSNSSIYKELHSEVGGIYDYLTKGIQDFNQILSNDQIEVTDNCFALLHLMNVLVYGGYSGSDLDRADAKEELANYRRAFEDPAVQSSFYQFISDGKRAYINLTRHDVRLQKLLEGII